MSGWHAEITGTNRLANSRAAVVVTFRHTDKREFSEEFIPGSAVTDVDEWLGRSASNRIVELDAADALLAKVVPGRITTTRSEQALPSDPAAAKWLSDLRRLEHIKTLIREGVLAPDAAEGAELRERLRKNFKATYLDLM